MMVGCILAEERFPWTKLLLNLDSSAIRLVIMKTQKKTENT